MTQEIILQTIKENSGTIKDRFKVRKLGIFGSYVRDDVKSSSDLDLLVEFDQPTFDNYMDLKFFLEELLGVNVDLVLADTLKSRLKPHIMKEIRYAEGL